MKRLAPWFGMVAGLTLLVVGGATGLAAFTSLTSSHSALRPIVDIFNGGSTHAASPQVDHTNLKFTLLIVGALSVAAGFVIVVISGIALIARGTRRAIQLADEHNVVERSQEALESAQDTLIEKSAEAKVAFSEGVARAQDNIEKSAPHAPSIAAQTEPPPTPSAPDISQPDQGA